MLLEHLVTPSHNSKRLTDSQKKKSSQDWKRALPTRKAARHWEPIFARVLVNALLQSQSKKLKENSEATQSNAHKCGQSLACLHQMTGATRPRNSYWASQRGTGEPFFLCSSVVPDVQLDTINLIPSNSPLGDNIHQHPPGCSWDTASTGKFYGQVLQTNT